MVSCTTSNSLEIIILKPKQFYSTAPTQGTVLTLLLSCAKKPDTVRPKVLIKGTRTYVSLNFHT